jgi:hypothetical protein
LAHNYIVLNHSFTIDPISGVHKLTLTPLQTVYPTHSLNGITCEKTTSQPNGSGVELYGIGRFFLNDSTFESLKSLLASGATVGVAYSCAHSPPTCSSFSFG